MTNNSRQIEIVNVDYNSVNHAKDLVDVLDSYANDPMGGSTPLPEKIKSELVQQLSKIPHAFSILSYVDQQPAGLINCFEMFSTFKGKPLINIHDIAVVSNFRGIGLSQLMLKKVEEIAIEKGCCKLTLEVLEGNIVAKNSYKKFGFDGYELDPEVGKALFWQKTLAD